MSLNIEDLVFYCRNCGKVMSMLDNSINKTFCSSPCKESLYRKRLRIKLIKNNGLNQLSGAIEDEIKSDIEGSLY